MKKSSRNRLSVNCRLTGYKQITDLARLPAAVRETSSRSFPKPLLFSWRKGDGHEREREAEIEPNYRQATDKLPTSYRQVTDSSLKHKVCRRVVSQQSTEGRLTDGRHMAGWVFRERFFTITIVGVKATTNCPT